MKSVSDKSVRTVDYPLNVAFKWHAMIMRFLCLSLSLISLLNTPPVFAASVSKSSNVTSWQISGAIAARKQNKGWNANLSWRQQGPNQYQIRLNGPLGNGAVLITKQGNTVTYRDGPKRLSSSNAAALLERETGIRLPVNYLYYWVRGLPAPGPVQSVNRDASNHVIHLRQAGYTIEYSHYKPVRQFHLPTRIRMQNNQVFIKFVIRQWGI